MRQIANRLGWPQRMHSILGQPDYAETVAPELSRGSHEYLYAALSDDVLFVRADVLGFLPDELDVTIESCRLTVSGRRTITEHPEARQHYLPRPMSRFNVADSAVAGSSRSGTIDGYPEGWDPRNFAADGSYGAQHAISNGQSMGCIRNRRDNQKQDQFSHEQIQEKGQLSLTPPCSEHSSSCRTSRQMRRLARYAVGWPGSYLYY